MNLRKLFISIIRTIYVNLELKLNSKPYLRKLIYNFYDRIWLIEYKIKFFIYKKIPQSNIIYVNPKRIKYEKDLNKNNWRLFLKFIKPLLNIKIDNKIQIVDGDWDLKENLMFFENHIKFKSYYQHFIKNIDWKDTPYYNREIKRYLKGYVRKEYDSVEELDLKFEYHDKLYQKIKSEGFKTQYEIIKLSGTIINYGHGPIIRKIDDDVTVGVGRNGDIIFFDGRHRLNIAKLLKIKKIPVRVLVIHPHIISKLKKKH